jgi:hypothetical protein
MGTLATVLLLPLMGPVWGLRFIIERVHEEAEAVMRDEGRAFAELIELSMRRSQGQLSDDEYAAQEAELLQRLGAIREYRDELLSADRDGDDDDLLDDELDFVEPTPGELLPGDMDLEPLAARELDWKEWQ